ncbi:glucosaminidase domain-containing protein [uncultured Bacteroides sp.]|uniref:glucosaminidase domain-containing protein n=1 Tax=uncultured Bacteroides sp. TaxID=162156 RepID=UPI002AAC2446|nr:glucosaminidase domain-containing protein [uncultured Bacteroides sp.]
MKFPRLIFVFALLFICTGMAQAQYRNPKYVAYVKQYSDLAVEQMKEYKIPASITLSQGLLESGAGFSSLAKESNNHFGIKCGMRWNGPTVFHNDDAPNECFRAYNNPSASYEDHSKFLTSGSRYAFLFRLDITDYKGWAKGLKQAGYATDPSYANRLITIIEDYELYKYDREGLSNKRNVHDRKEKKSIVPHKAYIANDLLYVIARRGDTFESIADEYNTSARKLIKYNDLNKDYTLAEGDIVYLHEKKKHASEKHTVHVVREDDSMHSISQLYGIRLKNLYKLNVKSGEYIPQVGDLIWLR